MGIATRATKQILSAYKAVRCVKYLTQSKLDALLETNPRYKLFEHDAQHPYYTPATCGQNTLTVYEELIAGVMNWTVDSGSISEELDRLKAWQIVNDEAADEELDALRLTQPRSMTEAEAADKLLLLFHSASSTLSKAELKAVNSSLAALHGRKHVAQHKEIPELSITTECRTAVREIKKLAKHIRDCGNGNSTIRRELEKQQVVRGLVGKGKDVVIDAMLK